MPEIAIEGDPAIDLGEALVLDDAADVERLRQAHAEGIPVVVRASTAEEVRDALARPEVASVLVPRSAAELVGLDLTRLTYEQ